MGKNSSDFAGFPKSTGQFLADLAQHNSKKWFEANREMYQASYLDPAVAFVEAIGPKLARLDGRLVAQPKINGSLRRIHRDVRFSKDKRPYKDHLDLFFWFHPDKKGPGLFVRIHADRVFLAAGMHQFDSARLADYRASVAERGTELAQVRKKLVKAGFEVAEPTYKRVPRGFDPDHPQEDLLRCSGQFAWREAKPAAVDLHSAKFVTNAVQHFRKTMPLNSWLLDL